MPTFERTGCAVNAIDQIRAELAAKAQAGREPTLPAKKPRKRSPPPRPVREVTQSAYAVGVEVVTAQTTSRLVTRRMACVTSAELRCMHCGCKWTVRFGPRRRPWRKCPRGCNRSRLAKG
jgi:hypothetical protein